MSYRYETQSSDDQLLDINDPHPHAQLHLASIDPVAHVHYIIVSSGEWAEADINEWDTWMRRGES